MSRWWKLVERAKGGRREERVAMLVGVTVGMVWEIKHVVLVLRILRRRKENARS